MVDFKPTISLRTLETNPSQSYLWHGGGSHRRIPVRKNSTPALAKTARPQRSKGEGRWPTPAKEQRRGPLAHARKGAKERGAKTARPQKRARARHALTSRGLCTGSSREAARKRMKSEISPELAKTGPWALGPRLGGARAHWAHARWSKKMEYFECRGLTASFVPFPKIILSKRDLCTKAERSHRFLFS